MSDVYEILERVQDTVRSPVAITAIVVASALGAFMSLSSSMPPMTTSVSDAFTKRMAVQQGPVAGVRRQAYWKARRFSESDARGNSEGVHRTFSYQDGSEIQLLGAYNAAPQWIMVTDMQNHEVRTLRFDGQGRPVLFQITRYDGAMKTVLSRVTAGYIDKRPFSLDALPPVSVETDGISEDGEMNDMQKAAFDDTLDDLAFFNGPNSPQ